MTENEEAYEAVLVDLELLHLEKYKHVSTDVVNKFYTKGDFRLRIIKPQYMFKAQDIIYCAEYWIKGQYPNVRNLITDYNDVIPKLKELDII